MDQKIANRAANLISKDNKYKANSYLSETTYLSNLVNLDKPIF